MAVKVVVERGRARHQADPGQRLCQWETGHEQTLGLMPEPM